MISTMSIKRSLALSIIRNSCVHDNVLPTTILEKLENCKTVLNTIIDDEIFQKFRVCALNQKRSKEPAITENTLLDITRRHFVSLHDWILLRRNFLWSSPFNSRHVNSVLWWIFWIIIQRLVSGWELRVSKQSIVVRTNLDNFLNLILNWIFFWLLMLHVIMLPIIHHFLTILSIHLISIRVLLKKFINLVLS